MISLYNQNLDHLRKVNLYQSCDSKRDTIETALETKKLNRGLKSSMTFFKLL